MVLNDPRVGRLLTLVLKAINAPPGNGRVALAVLAGVICHLMFGLGAGAMIVSMYHGLTLALGNIPWPWAILTNAILILQFPALHSLLLTRRGTAALRHMIPGPHGSTLATTTYVTIASVQLLLLFVLWTPSGIVWWQAEGAALWTLSVLYACAWLLLMKASFDAGAEVQSGALGWMALLSQTKPVFPDMPTLGLFKLVRQPIYVAFTLTLWTVPIWTPDQFALATAFTAYCIFAPRLKERRFADRYGQRFERYRQCTPYFVPTLTRRGSANAERPDDL